MSGAGSAALEGGFADPAVDAAHVFRGDVRAIVPAGLRVQVEGIGAAIGSDFPEVGQPGRRWLSGEDVGSDELLIEQINNSEGILVVGEEWVNSLNVAGVGVNEGAAGGGSL